MDHRGDLYSLGVVSYTIDRDTVFVYEEDEWEHRLGEEMVFFMPDASIEESKKSC